MKNIHFPKNFKEAVYSPITLVSGTALLATIVLLTYRFIENADGNVLLDIATKNLIN